MKTFTADLRVFGAIGFQNLWLRRQKYEQGEKSLIERLTDRAIDKGVDVIGLTSEDDKMLPGYPEDRFGYVKDRIPLGYDAKETEKGVLRIEKKGNIGVLCIVNSETRHPNSELGQDWKGLKLHVVGGNLLPKHLDLEDAIKDANDRGYMTFLMGVSNFEAQDLADKFIDECTGSIGHDANNTFRLWMTKIPKIGNVLAPYSRAKNESAIDYTTEREKPAIAVSSAHWMHEIGNAGIKLEIPEGQEFRLVSLKDAITKGQFYLKEGHNNPLDVLRFGYLLRKHGSAPDRFAGTESSYNP